MSAATEPLRDSYTLVANLPVLRKPLCVAVTGNPNTGKTSLFNVLTGLRQKVANYPGVTVETKMGQWPVVPTFPPAQVIDLPGLYSLDATSLDEEIARDVLLGRTQKIQQPDVVVIAVDATNLSRNLYLATQLIETGIPIVIALTMFDLAERSGIRIDVQKLSTALGVQVIPIIARRRSGLVELGRAVLSAATACSKEKPNCPASLRPRWSSVHGESWQQMLTARYRWIENVVGQVVETDDSQQPNLSERIDAVVTHKLVGPLILFVVMLLIFQTIFSWASLPMNWIDHGFSAFGSLLRAYLPSGILTDLLVDGVVTGVGGVLVFLPQILLLFFFISLLEETGYMARAAFLMDRLMRAVGLSGKAFVPLLSSFACAVPGIMATRTIENPRDRIATIMIAPFMSCSARLPVYTLMIAAFFSGQRVFGVFSLGAVIILGMYLLGIAIAIGVGWILKRTVLKGPSLPFAMELPPYRLPNLSNVGYTLLARAGAFLKQAGTVILAISILMWFLIAFPRSQTSQVENSYAGRAGHQIESLIAPLGFDWKIGIGLISSFAARETVISTLSIIYNADAGSGATQTTSLVDAMGNARRPDGSKVWTPLVALSLMVFFVLACQCMSTVAIVRRETNSWRWPIFMVGYMLVLAYAGAFITYQGGRLFGLG